MMRAPLSLLTAAFATLAGCEGFEASPSPTVDSGGAAEAAPVDPVRDAGSDDASAPRCAHCRSKFCDDAGACDPLVFVTEQTFAGGLAPSAADAGAGLARADEICQSEAGPGAVFHAWLSNDQTDALPHVVGNGPASSRPLRLHDGTIVADSLASLLASGANAPIRLTASGTPVPGVSFVWTGTQASGARITGATCLNWTSSVGGAVGSQGATVTSTAWTTEPLRVNVPCNEPARFYCFEELH